MNIKTESGIIKETTQIPANLVSEDDNNAFFISNLAQAFGKNIPQEMWAQLNQLIFTDCIQDPRVWILATPTIAQSHASEWLFRIESTALTELISLLAFHIMPLLLQKMDKNQKRHP